MAFDEIVLGPSVENSTVFRVLLTGISFTRLVLNSKYNSAFIA
jgi:hypothetical protein